MTNEFEATENHREHVKTLAGLAILVLVLSTLAAPRIARAGVCLMPATYKTIQATIDGLRCTDIAIQNAGPYNETLQIERSLSITGQVSLINAESAGAVITVGGVRCHFNARLGFQQRNEIQRFQDHLR